MPNGPRNIALCLSGGGFRATFFHLGTIKALQKTLALIGGMGVCIAYCLLNVPPSLPIPIIIPNAAVVIGRLPSRRTAVAGRTALSRIAPGCPFRSNLTAANWPGFPPARWPTFPSALTGENFYKIDRACCFDASSVSKPRLFILSIVRGYKKSGDPCAPGVASMSWTLAD